MYAHGEYSLGPLISTLYSTAYLLKVIVEKGKDSSVVADSDLMRHWVLFQFWQIRRFDSAKNILAQIMRFQL